jgi:hypothetical protein
MASPSRAKLDALLNQRVRANGDHAAPCSDALARLLSLLVAQPADQQFDADAQRLEQAVQVDVVLFRQNLGGRHHRRLVLVVDGCQDCRRRNDGLARSDIALQQAVHRVGLRHVAPDFANHTLLGVREFERHDAVQHLVQAVGVDAHGDSALLARALTLHADAELHQEKLLEHQSLPRGVDRLLAVGEVNLRNRLLDGHQPESLAHAAGQDFGREVRILHGVPDESGACAFGGCPRLVGRWARYGSRSAGCRGLRRRAGLPIRASPSAVRRATP